MPIVVAFDGGDSPLGGCTTHLLYLFARIASKRGWRISSYPRLIRLNPSVPMKTRGNGAVALPLDLEESRLNAVFELAVEFARRYASVFRSGKIGVAVAHLDRLDDPPPELRRVYHLALHSIVTREFVDHIAKKLGILTWGGQGVIGAVAALAADLNYDYTFEALIYMRPECWGKRPKVDLKEIYMLECKYRGLLANYDYIISRILVQPHGPDPVFAGVRGEHPDSTLQAAIELAEKHRSCIDSILLYQSNQHTGVHVRPSRIDAIRAYECVVVEGFVREVRTLTGGHVSMQLCEENDCVDVMVYRETGLAKMLQNFRGGFVIIQGCVKPRGKTLVVNAERIQIVEGLYYTTPVSNLLFEPIPSAWHHLYQPAIREIRVQKPKGRPKSTDKVIIQLNRGEQSL